MQLLKCHLQTVLTAIILNFVLPQKTSLHMKINVGGGRCGFILCNICVWRVPWNIILFWERKKSSHLIQINIRNSFSYLSLKKLNLFLIVSAGLFWNDYTGYPLHGVWVFEHITRFHWFISPPTFFFPTSFSNYFDTQLLKSRQEMLRDWPRAGSQPVKTLPDQNNVSLAFFPALWN